jgi:hypothetical protein
VYQIEFAADSVADFGTLFGGGPSAFGHAFEATVEGELTITVLEATPEHATLVYELRPVSVRFDADGRDEPEQAEGIQAGLTHPMFAVLDARGRILSARFDPSISPMTQHMARTLLAATQFVGPGPNAGPRAEWEAEEDDPGGTLVAGYQAREGGAVRKTKVRYFPPAPAKKRGTTLLTPEVQFEGESLITIESGCVSALSAGETRQLTLRGKRIGHGSLRVSLRLLRREQAAPAELADLSVAEADRGGTARSVRLCVAPSPEESRLAIQRRELGDATVESLLADLAEIAAVPLRENDRTRLFLKFKALAVVRPESCSRLGALVAGAAADSLVMRVLTDSLEAAGHAQAQAALIAAIDARPDDWRALARLIPALGMAEAPTPETEQALLTLAFGKRSENVTAAARLALGNLARTLGEVSPARASKVVRRLLQELASPTSAESAWQLLLALGNAGSAEALPTLERFLDEPMPDLRGAAAWALRWIDSPRADLLLTSKALLSDREPAVRLEAVRALRCRAMTPANFAAHEQALAAETEAAVRLALLASIWDAREAYPRALRLIREVAATDPVPEVRATAARLLETASVEP